MLNILNCKCSDKWTGFAPLVLRVVVGVAFMLHGWQKVQMGNAAIGGFFDSLGIPAANVFAFIITYLEFLGGIALILGVLTHLVSKLLVIDMVVATLLVHLKNGFLGQGGFELTLLLAAACFSLMITGPGKWALNFKKPTAPTQTV